MTKEDAANILDLKTRPDALADFVGPELAGMVHQAMIMGAEALRGPQPDPITGLMPCGCGGRAKQGDFFDGFFYFGAISCLGCEIELRIPSLTPEESSGRVKVAWNRAMGWKGGAE